MENDVNVADNNIEEGNAELNRTEPEYNEDEMSMEGVE